MPHLSLHPDSTWDYQKNISDVDSGGGLDLLVADVLAIP